MTKTQLSVNFHMQDFIGLCSRDKLNMKGEKYRDPKLSAPESGYDLVLCFMAFKTRMSSKSNSAKFKPDYIAHPA